MWYQNNPKISYLLEQIQIKKKKEKTINPIKLKHPPTVLFSNNPKAPKKKKKNTQRIETKLNMTKLIKKNSSILIYFPLFSRQPNRAYKGEIRLRKFTEQWVWGC